MTPDLRHRKSRNRRVPYCSAGREKIRNEKKRKEKKKKKKKEQEKKKQILYEPPVTGYRMEDLDARGSQVFIELQKPEKVGEAIFSDVQENVQNR